MSRFLSCWSSCTPVWPRGVASAVVLALPALATVVFLESARAGGIEATDEARKRVEAAISACWNLSRAERSTGVTADMRHGGMVTATCLEGVLQDEMRGLLSASSYEELDLPAKLDALRNSYGSIYWQLYNGGRPGGGWRGTMYQVFHVAAYANLLEDLIRKVAAERDGPIP